MITSGLLVQNRAHFRGFHSQTRAERNNNVLLRPYVDGFDTGVTKVSEPFQIGPNGLPPQVPKQQVIFRNIFGRASSADERLQNVGRPEGTKIPRLGARQTNFYSPGFKTTTSQEIGDGYTMVHTTDYIPNPYAGKVPVAPEVAQEYREVERAASETSERQSVVKNVPGLVSPVETTLSQMDEDKQSLVDELDKMLADNAERETALLLARIHNLETNSPKANSPKAVGDTMEVDDPAKMRKKGPFDLPPIDTNVMNVELPSRPSPPFAGIVPTLPGTPYLLGAIHRDKLANTAAHMGMDVDTPLKKAETVNVVTKKELAAEKRRLKRAEKDAGAEDTGVKDMGFNLANIATKQRGKLKKAADHKLGPVLEPGEVKKPRAPAPLVIGMPPRRNSTNSIKMNSPGAMSGVSAKSAKMKSPGAMSGVSDN